MTDDSLGRIIENVVRETVPQTIRLRVSITQSDASDGSSSLVLEQTYLETDRGERYFDEKIIIPSEHVRHRASYCDGKKCANIAFLAQDPDRQDAMTIGHDFMLESINAFRDAPPPFRYYHVGLVPLHEALGGADAWAGNA